MLCRLLSNDSLKMAQNPALAAPGQTKAAISAVRRGGSTPPLTIEPDILADSNPTYAGLVTKDSAE
jgi:hypothetical protein